MVLSSITHTIETLDIDFSISSNGNISHDIKNEVYTYTGGGLPPQLVIQWQYNVYYNTKTLLDYVFTTTADVVSVIDYDNDLPVLSNLVKDSYNEAAIAFQEKVGMFPLMSTSQLNEISLRLLESVEEGGLYE